mgnify:CR=1 FL=1
MNSITNFLKPYLDKIKSLLSDPNNRINKSVISIEEQKKQIETDRQTLKDFFDEDIIDISEFYDGLDGLKERELQIPRYQKYADAIILNNDGKILLLRRAITDTFYPDCYSLPGGKIEEGEEPKEAVLREVLEETGLTFTSSEQLGEKKIDNGEIHYFKFVCDEMPAIILDTNEHLNWKFVSLIEMQDMDLILDLYETLKDLLKIFPTGEQIGIEKAEKQKWSTKSELKELEGHAKKSSQDVLEMAVKEHSDPTIRTHAHKELKRREEEEANKDDLKGYKAHEYHGKDFKYDKETDSYLDEEGGKANKTKLHEYNSLRHAELSDNLDTVTKELSESTKQKDSLKNKLVKEYYIKIKKSRFVGSTNKDEAVKVAKVKLEKMGLCDEDIDSEKLNKILDSKFKEKIID